MNCIGLNRAAFRSTGLIPNRNAFPADIFSMSSSSRWGGLHGCNMNVNNYNNKDRRVMIPKQAYSGRAMRVFALSGQGPAEIKLSIEGMMCDGCTGRVEEVLQVSKTMDWFFQ